MSDAIRNLALLVWAVCAVNTAAYAQEKPGIAEENETLKPTVVYGSAAKAGGGEDTFVVEQPDGGENPLGNPIPEQIAPAGAGIGDEGAAGAVAAGGITAGAAGDADRVGAVPTVNDAADKTQGSDVVGETPAQKLGKDFQNTVLESNGMVYDVQAFPEADLPVISDPANPETIYSPNVNNP